MYLARTSRPVLSRLCLFHSIRAGGRDREGCRQSVRREDDLDRVRHLERQIAQVDAQIDQRVYALYGLTEGEIKIVQGAKRT